MNTKQRKRKNNICLSLQKSLLENYKRSSECSENCIKVGMNTCSISSGAKKIYNALIKAVKEKIFQ